jgi:signal transduction histidine kinase
LLVQAAVPAVAVGAVLLVGGLPLAAAGRLGAAAFTMVAAAASLVVLAVAAGSSWRWVGRPLERMLRAARVLGERTPELPPLGPEGEEGAGLSRAAVAFERLAAALAEERRGLAAKVAELEAANRSLAAARAELDRAERLATVGRLAAGIAHEVGNPLGAIGGYAELALDRAGRAGAPAELEDFLRRILEETRRIDAIVRDLLDFARPLPPVLAPVQLAGPVDAALRLARVQPRFRDVAVEASLPAGLPPVLADERRLAQVLLNLLLNAADAMAGGGRVTVRARAAGGAVEVDVEDTGPGIAAEHLPHVFEPFFTTKGPGRGTGLGLSVCHGIVTSFGGAITVASSPGGARFVLRLPAAPGPGEPGGAC